MTQRLLIPVLLFISIQLLSQTDEFINQKSFEARNSNFKQGYGFRFGFGGSLIGKSNDIDKYQFDQLKYKHHLSDEEISDRYTFDRKLVTLSGFAMFSKRFNRFEIGVPLEISASSNTATFNSNSLDDDSKAHIIRLGSGLDFEIHQSIKGAGKSTIFLGYNLGTNLYFLDNQNAFGLSNKFSLGLSINNNGFNAKPHISFGSYPVSMQIPEYNTDYDLSHWMIWFGVKLGFIK